MPGKSFECFPSGEGDATWPFESFLMLESLEAGKQNFAVSILRFPRSTCRLGFDLEILCIYIIYIYMLHIAQRYIKSDSCCSVGYVTINCHCFFMSLVLTQAPFLAQFLQLPLRNGVLLSGVLARDPPKAAG